MAPHLYLDELERNLSALNIEFLCNTLNSNSFTLNHLLQTCICIIYIL
jgi:hypothetical protein